MNHAARALLDVHLKPWRARLLSAAILLWLAALVVRALYLQGWQKDYLREKGAQFVNAVLEIPANRGMVTDRRGEPLAISTPMSSLWASPEDVNFTDEQLRRLARVLEMDSRILRDRLSDTRRGFIFIKRRLPPDVAEAALMSGVRGLYAQREYRRYYPAGEVTAHLLGFTDVDDHGQEGMELTHEEWLAGSPGNRRVVRDRKGNVIEDVEALRAPRPGRDLRLSIDLKIQYLAYRELEHAVLEHRAKGGGLVVLDADTGEILASANAPSYNPNNRTQMAAGRTRNRVITDVFEPGSTMKAFTVAAALEAGVVTPETVIDVQGPLVMGDARIHDAHPHGRLTVTEVIQKSSNVGAARMALSLSPEYLWGVLDRAGFGRVPRAGFPGEATGRLRPWKSWVRVEQATMSYGHGISVSLLQLARAYTVFAGDGELKSVTMVRTDSAAPGVRVFSPETARAVRTMLETVIEPGGTAPRAAIPGYRVAGKTGTAHKIVDGEYAHKLYVSSFVGMAPASAPRLIVAVMLDEPAAGQYYGGTVAAPVFANVMGGALRLLAVSPDAPLTHRVLPEDLPELPEGV